MFEKSELKAVQEETVNALETLARLNRAGELCADEVADAERLYNDRLSAFGDLQADAVVSGASLDTSTAVKAIQEARRALESAAAKRDGIARRIERQESALSELEARFESTRAAWVHGRLETATRELAAASGPFASACARFLAVVEGLGVWGYGDCIRNVRVTNPANPNEFLVNFGLSPNGGGPAWKVDAKARKAFEEVEPVNGLFQRLTAEARRVRERMESERQFAEKAAQAADVRRTSATPALAPDYLASDPERARLAQLAAARVPVNS